LTNVICNKARGCILILILCVSFGPLAVGADSAANSEIQLDTAGAQPRAMEDLTRTAIARDYGRAWQNLSQAFETSSSQSLDAYFVGSARKDLGDAIESQQKSGLQSRYISPQHSLKVVFYAPEGDVVELQDTVHCTMQVADGKKVIDDHPVVLHYVVLMTPAADRWVVRQLQAVPQF
jgi:hypothetical protein